MNQDAIHVLAVILVCAAPLSVGMADEVDDLVGSYVGSWKSSNGEKGAALLVLESGTSFGRKAAVGSLKLENVSQDFFGHAKVVAIFPNRDLHGKDYLDLYATYKEASPRGGQKMVSLSNRGIQHHKVARKTAHGLEFNEVRLDFFQGDGTPPQQVTLSLDFKKQ